MTTTEHDEDTDDDGSLDGDLDAPAEMPRGVFADTYPELRRLDWSGVLWLPEGEKSPPLGRDELPLRRSLTGHNGVDCDNSELYQLATSTLRGRSGARGNIAVRAQSGVIKDGAAYDLVFLDVDDYPKGDQVKTGGKTVADLEAAAGEQFPPTCKLSSRGEGVSGKYAYLVPAGARLVPKLPDVELVQHHHRYAVVPPSINQDSGGTPVVAYSGAAPRAGECAGVVLSGMFRPEHAAVMPAGLLARLQVEATPGGSATTEEVSDFLAALPVDQFDPEYLCKAVTNALNGGIEAMQCKGSAYEAARGAVMALLRAGRRQHVGVPAALVRLEEAYVATQNGPRDSPATARKEMQRLIRNPRGVGTILATPDPAAERGCRCSLVLTDEDIRLVLEVQGEAMADDLRAMVGAERYDAVVGVATTAGELPVPRQGWTAPEHTPQAANGHEVAPRNGHAVAAVAAPAARPATGTGRETVGAVPDTRTGIPPLHEYTPDDRGNGQRFIAVWGGDVAYVPEPDGKKATYIWTGNRWEVDSGVRLRHLAERLTDYMRVEALARIGAAQRRLSADEEGEDHDAAKEQADQAKAYMKWVGLSRMDARLKACVTSATSHPGVLVKPGDWDADSWLVNFVNRTIRLELDGTHTSHEPRREDRLTQQSGTVYDPRAVCPLFDAFLQHALPDPAVRRLLRAMMGRSLVGNNAPKKFPHLLGKGDCGKTTLAEGIAAVLDNPAARDAGYSGSFRLADLRPKKNDNGPNAGLFRIVRRRFVYCAESNDDGGPLNADLMKRFSGGDRQQARDTYGGSTGIDDRPPAFTPWMAANDPPPISGADAALWERIVVFPFVVPIVDKDIHFAEKLKAEYSGMLNWLLAGYRDSVENPWLLDKLPEACIEAAENMRKVTSIHDRWLGEETVDTPVEAGWVTVKESWQQFRLWCDDSREKSGTHDDFTKALARYPSVVKRRPFGSTTKPVRVRQGLGWSQEHTHRTPLVQVMANSPDPTR